MVTATEQPRATWTDGERRAWSPPERLRPSQWAERYRDMTARQQTLRRGMWRNDDSPHLTGIMDMCARRGVSELTVMKAAQIGVSESIRNVIGIWAHLDPRPVLLVLPNEKLGRGIMAERIIPFIEDTPVLAELETKRKRDMQLGSISLRNGFTLRLGWAGSASSLAVHPARCVLNDEVDKFETGVGDEADPIALAERRMTSFEGRSLMVNISTPTIRTGLIFKRFDGSNCKLFFFVPCPHCGKFQRLSFDQLRWEKFEIDDPAQRADAIIQQKAAWYVCACCGGEIRERHRYAMLNRGVYATEQATFDESGVVDQGQEIRGRVGMHVSALVCPWISFAKIAADFVKIQGDPSLLQDFRNSVLGEPFETQTHSTKEDAFAERCTIRLDRDGKEVWRPSPAGVLPRWAVKLVATADTQKDHFYYVIRAWAHGFRSQRIRHGRCETFEELREICLNAEYRFEGDAWAAMRPEVLGIDSGGGREEGAELSRTEQVYRFAQSDPRRILAVKGASKTRVGVPIQVRKHLVIPPHLRGRTGKVIDRYEIFLYLLNTGHFKDLLSERLKATIDTLDPATGELIPSPAWALNDQNDEDYNRQMASEHKVVLRDKSETWVPKSTGAATHLWDCEVYNLAMAYQLRVDLLPTDSAVEEIRGMAAKPRPQIERKPQTWLNRGAGGWVR